MQDLTAFEEYTDASCGHSLHVNMLQQVDLFEMTATEDECWTFSPDLHQVHHVRALSNFCAGQTVEVLLGPGADASVLP